MTGQKNTPVAAGGKQKNGDAQKVTHKEIDFKEANRRGLALIRVWLPDGHQEGTEWVCRNPTRADAHEGSFSVNETSGQWADFATGDKGGDSVSLLAFLRGLSQAEAARELLGITVPDRAPATRKAKPKAVMPVPTEAGQSIKSATRSRWALDTYGEPVAGWLYHDQAGDELFRVIRFEQTDPQGKVKKAVVPYHFAADCKWHPGQPLDRDRPLFNLPALLASPLPVLIVEGEKCSSVPVPGFILTCWAGGAEAVAKAAWKPLEGRHVVVWPDADDPGRRAAAEIAKRLPQAEILDIQDRLAGWDIADAEAQGLDLAAFIRDCPRLDPTEPTEYEPAAKLPGSLAPTAPTDRFTPEDVTERGLVELFKEMNVGQVCYVPAWGSWLLSDGIAMRVDAMNRPMALVDAAIRRMHAMIQYGETFGFDAREECRKRLSKLDRANTLKAVQTRLEADPAVTKAASDFNKDDCLINCLNGVVNLRTGSLLPPDPAAWTKSASANYDPAAPQPLRFLEFMMDLCADRPDLLAWTVRYLGYCLSGSIADQSMLILYGSGANGKGVLFEILRSILGGFFWTADPALLLDDSKAHPHHIANLEGMRLAAIAEIPKGAIWNDGRVKNLTGDNEITGRGMYQGNKVFHNTAKLIVSSNTLPITKANDNGFHRRLRLFPADHSVPPEKRNPNLAAEILAQEKDAIFSELVRQAGRWYQFGMPEKPACMIQTEGVYRTDNDRLSGFLAECTKTGGSIGGHTLFDEHGTWCTRNGEDQIRRRTFYKMVEERGYRRTIDAKRQPTFHGIQLTGGSNGS